MSLKLIQQIFVPANLAEAPLLLSPHFPHFFFLIQRSQEIQEVQDAFSSREFHHPSLYFDCNLKLHRAVPDGV